MTTQKKTRSRIGRTRRGRGLPRIMWVAIAVCVIGAVLIFRDQGGDVPTGIGEYQTVVTAPDNEEQAVEENDVRSGDVEITAETTTLTPEKPEAGSTVPVEEKKTATPEVKQATSNPTPKPTTTKSTSTPKPALIQPQANGPYMVQTGSFGDPENADKEADRLKRLGFDARVKMGNTSDDKLFYRVKIGYFKSRAEAETFIKQNKKSLPRAIPAHR